MCESCRKLDLGFLLNKTETFYVSATHLILRLAIVQNKFQQANKTKINNINDNHIEFEVSLHFWGIWPTVWHLPRGKITGVAAKMNISHFFYEMLFIYYLYWHNFVGRHLLKLILAKACLRKKIRYGKIDMFVKLLSADCLLHLHSIIVLL
jgi:hypothetical protein